MKLWLGNIDPETTDDELRELVRKYAKLEVSDIARETGGGSRYPSSRAESRGRSGRSRAGSEL